MKLFLTIVAGIVVGFALVVLLLFLFVRYKLRRMMGGLADLAKHGMKGIAPFMQPLRIHLKRQRNTSWTDQSAVDRIVQPLLAAGFQDAGTFVVEEAPDIQLQGLVQPDKAVLAAVYEHPDKGVWFDVVSCYEDGVRVTSTTNEPNGLDRSPQFPLERFARDDDPLHVYEEHLSRRPQRPLTPASVEEFASAFERAYAEEMDWRFERGGFTEAEIRDTLKLTEGETDDTMIKQVHAMQQMAVGQWLQTKLQEVFRNKSNVSEAKWRRIEDRVIFIHDRLTGSEVHEAFLQCLGDEEDEDEDDALSEEAERLAHPPAREAFVAMLKLLPERRMPRKLMHLTQPVAADVYLCVDEDEEAD